jgi:amidophosphoribosyltransferase
MARDVGAVKVIMASCAPPIRFPNVYGIDMPSRLELVAHNRTEQQISDYIGADLTIFQTIEDLVAACQQFNPSIEQFDCSVFTGEYITGGVDEAYLQGIETLRSDNAKIKANAQARHAREPVVNVSAGSGGHGAPGGNHNEGGSASTVSSSMPMNEIHADLDDQSPDTSQVVGLSNAGEGGASNLHDVVVGLSNEH